MGNLDLLLEGFQSALSAQNLMYGLLGTFLGTLVGVLPGIGPALAIALLLPVTFSVEPTSALIMFAAVFYGAMYGGSTTSILLNTPGEAGAVITSLEGHQMAKRGRAGAALTTAALGSFVAGLIATIFLAAAAPALAELALKVQPAGYVALILAAFITVGTLLGNSKVRGLMSLSIGLIIGLVGLDQQTGISRINFGIQDATDGIEVIVVVISFFALGEVIYYASRFKDEAWKVLPVKGKVWMDRNDFKRSWKPWLRGTAIGFPMGIIPAGGSEVPTFMSYSLEKKLSKNKDEFGSGAIEGVAGPEAANNANAAGVLVPLLALGLPTSATAAIMLVALRNFNIQPGPMLFELNAPLVWTLIASLFIGNTLLLLINLPLIRIWIKLLQIPRHYLYAGITTFGLLGAYSLNNSLFDMRMALILGFVGYLFRRFGVPNTPLVLGVILGPVLEIQFRQAIQLSNGDYSILLAGLLPKAIYLGLVLVIFLPNVINLFKKRATKVQS
ncbi:MAG: tripartite tricarboxylate transporter permease [Candidatus Nanopelagicaceae bacterium]|jgi:putative tricarboxylic transport membrane protein|nr:tripartite tricarboxylate transporter permease [Candidatus Nanopelagicaceae bacterium]